VKIDVSATFALFILMLAVVAIAVVQVLTYVNN
jgi:hypothetical protein